MRAMASRFIVIAALATGLSGCFQPLYGNNSSFSSIKPEMEQITIAPIAGHLGHELTSELAYQFTNGNPVSNPLYRLKINTTTTTGAVIVDSAADRPQTVNYSVTANYTLTSVKDGRLITAATARAIVTYDRDSQRYATVQAQKNAEIRAAKTLVEQIKSRIISDLARNKGL